MCLHGIIRVIIVNKTTLLNAIPIKTSIPGITKGPNMTKVYKKPVIVDGSSNLILKLNHFIISPLTFNFRVYPSFFVILRSIWNIYQF